ncbi:hypothetical protein PPERSA_10652 [Pseudocohnilembus persalinus]|uniref:Uncharacterized protein n=1 Tax=Pseudocohnilembus persalinus TaxID=266149 RepID=A0A0V0QD56_PSEPJ|nr:hypothetical protein PPERSA_10652 [Pseudocohnilembus persalinus]|eukprot:KRX00153.1 hypothetical protein PPERSA_10652 [Pseudocohnilembus persalinus]
MGCATSKQGIKYQVQKYKVQEIKRKMSINTPVTSQALSQQQNGPVNDKSSISVSLINQKRKFKLTLYSCQNEEAINEQVKKNEEEILKSQQKEYFIEQLTQQFKMQIQMKQQENQQQLQLKQTQSEKYCESLVDSDNNNKNNKYQHRKCYSMYKQNESKFSQQHREQIKKAQKYKSQSQKIASKVQA